MTEKKYNKTIKGRVLITNKFTPTQKRWLEALESGKFKQGIGNLCSLEKPRHRSYCCLGVAAKLLGCAEKRIAKANCVLFDGKDTTAPDKVIKALRLYGGVGQAKKARQHTSLAQRNDSGDYDFKQIAAEIRAKPWVWLANFSQPKGRPRKAS
jgi:hypothetical protein